MTAVVRVTGSLFHPNCQLKGKIFWVYHILFLNLFSFFWKGLCFPFQVKVASRVYSLCLRIAVEGKIMPQCTFLG